MVSGSYIGYHFFVRKFNYTESYFQYFDKKFLLTNTNTLVYSNLANG